MAKRDIFAELAEGVAAMKSHREGKLMLRSYKVDGARSAPAEAYFFASFIGSRAVPQPRRAFELRLSCPQYLSVSG